MKLEKVAHPEIAQFRQIVEAYWRELMPKASIIQNAEQRQAYFAERFAWDGGNHQPHWGIVDGRHIGFVAFTISANTKSAMIEDFYVRPEARRQGYGSAMVAALFTHLDQLGVMQIDLNVRRDKPDALAFWQAQGFGIALYRLRMYRDPETGTAFQGALSSDF